MPVQINEVIIRTVVDSRPGTATPTAESLPASGVETELLGKVLEIIKEKKER